MRRRYSYGRHPYPLSNFLVSLCRAQNKKLSQFIYYKPTQALLQHTRLLYEQGYIAGYHCGFITPHINFVVLDLKYTRDQLPLIRAVHFFSSPNRQWSIRLKDVHKLLRRSYASCYIVSTPAGLKTIAECASSSLSGLLLYKLN
jgi:ribosomal protein S8